MSAPPVFQIRADKEELTHGIDFRNSARIGSSI